MRSHSDHWVRTSPSLWGDYTGMFLYLLGLSSFKCKMKIKIIVAGSLIDISKHRKMLRYFTQIGRKFHSKMYAVGCVFGCKEKISVRMLQKYTALSLRRGVIEVDGKGRREVSFPISPFSSAWIALFYFYSLIIKSRINHSGFCLVGLLWGSNKCEL